MDAQRDQTSAYDQNEDDHVPGAPAKSRPGQDPMDGSHRPVKDGYGNLVSGKPANKGVLASQRKRLAHERLVAEQASSRAASSTTSSSSSSSSSTSPSGAYKTIRSLFILALFLPLLSQFLTGAESNTFYLSPHIVPPIRKWWRASPWNPSRVRPREFSPLQLSQYDGSDPAEPLYLAIGGEVYDVSANRRMYGPGGSYSTMAGKDASRSFITGCFYEHQTHDLRGLSADDLKALDGWKAFFANHEKYHHVGRVRNAPIDPASPIPEPCDGDASSLGRTAGDQRAHGKGGHGQGGGQGGVKVGAPPVQRP